MYTVCTNGNQLILEIRKRLVAEKSIHEYVAFKTLGEARLFAASINYELDGRVTGYSISHHLSTLEKYKDHPHLIEYQIIKD